MHLGDKISYCEGLSCWHGVVTWTFWFFFAYSLILEWKESDAEDIGVNAISHVKKKTPPW